MKLRHVDLFCGIGGFTQGMKGYAETVWANDIDDDMACVYAKNHPNVPTIIGDIKNIRPGCIPAHDILTGGFPCQPFSVGGHRKSFHDDRGNLFWEIVKVAQVHKPKLIIMENVKGLLNMNKGRDLQFIKDQFGEIGYYVSHICLNASSFNVPQARERLFIVCSLEPIYEFDIEYPTARGQLVTDVLWREIDVPSHLYLHETMLQRGYKFKEHWSCRSGIMQELNQLGYYTKNGSKSSKANRVYCKLGLAPTQIVAWGGSCGAQTGLFKLVCEEPESIRKLHVEESKRVMGFPKDYFIFGEEKLKRKAYQQTGNAVVPQVVTGLFKSLLKVL